MPTLYTIGHSNHSWEEFLAILKAHKIKHLIDIRTIPRSRFVPWTNQKSLEALLKKEKITYQNMRELGGMRHSNKNSINQAWKNASFRGFADYMQTPEFFDALKKLILKLKKGRTAIMCAEAVPWRCHRSLISDALIVRRVKVIHLLSKSNTKEHEITEFAVVNKKVKPVKIYYPKDKNLVLAI